jgi:hypothetical protein
MAEPGGARRGHDTLWQSRFARLHSLYCHHIHQNDIVFKSTSEDRGALYSSAHSTQCCCAGIGTALVAGSRTKQCHMHGALHDGNASAARWNLLEQRHHHRLHVKCIPVKSSRASAVVGGRGAVGVWCVSRQYCCS